jgi:hypothetical protein
MLMVCRSVSRCAGDDRRCLLGARGGAQPLIRNETLTHSSKLCRCSSPCVLHRARQDYGWNNIVQAQLLPRHLTRVDDTTLVLTLPPFGAYEITAPETLRFVVPPAAVVSRTTIIANVSLVLIPTMGFATLNGSLLSHLGEGHLVASPPLYLDVTLHGDVWAPNVTAHNSSLLHTLIGGFSASTPRVTQLGALRTVGNATACVLAGGVVLPTGECISSDANVTLVQEYRHTGWDDTVRPRLSVERMSDRVLRFTLPPTPEYDLLSTEVVELVLAPSLVRSRNPPPVRPSLLVRPSEARAYSGLTHTVPSPPAACQCTLLTGPHWSSLTRSLLHCAGGGGAAS